MPSPVMDRALDRAMELARVDLSPRHRGPRRRRRGRHRGEPGPVPVRRLVAGRAGVAVFPATKGYVHFQFGDYAKLTIIGVLIACAAWPVVARVTSDPRWVFFRLAILVTVVLLLPDVYIWMQGQSGQAVMFLVLMHLAIAVITYNLLVRVAPVRAPASHGRADGGRYEYGARHR